MKALLQTEVAVRLKHSTSTSLVSLQKCKSKANLGFPHGVFHVLFSKCNYLNRNGTGGSEG